MTTVYGVTFIGAKAQIERQLKDRGDIPPERLYKCSVYLGRLVLDSIGDLFKGAAAIQTWLNRCARLIAKSIPPQRIEAALQQETKPGKGKAKKPLSLSRIPKEQMTSVVWTTPLGLPVCQPYRRPKKKQVQTALQTVHIWDPSIPAEVDPRAQATAFPPNFIHSLDATHMMMTALACKVCRRFSLFDEQTDADARPTAGQDRVRLGSRLVLDARLRRRRDVDHSPRHLCRPPLARHPRTLA